MDAIFEEYPPSAHTQISIDNIIEKDYLTLNMSFLLFSPNLKFLGNVLS